MLYYVYPNGTAPLRIVQLGYCNDVQKARFGPSQRRPYYIVTYVIKGRGFFNGNLVEKGQGFLITPYSFEHYYPDENNPWEFVWALTDDENMAEIFQTYNANPNSKIFSFADIQAAESFAHKVVYHHQTLLPASVLLEWFLNLYNSHQPVGVNVGRKDYLAVATEYIETNIHQKIAVKTLTELLGISQAYLFKLFQKQYSLSPKDYISTRKLFHAKKILRESDFSITEIAQSVGFDDVLSFSRFFSKNEGRSPTKYRSQSKKESDV